jgi:hypothetical protein
MTHRTTSQLKTIIAKSRQKKRGAKTKHYAEIDGETRSIQQWASDFDLKYYTVLKRFKRGVTGRDLIAPEQKKCNDYTRKY